MPNGHAALLAFPENALDVASALHGLQDLAQWQSAVTIPLHDQVPYSLNSFRCLLEQRAERWGGICSSCSPLLSALFARRLKCGEQQRSRGIRAAGTA